jgi:uncharacterized protein YecE (DUF72 family)
MEPGPEIRVGCSSWTSPAWTGRFYPSGLPDGQRLSHYARRFDCVEVDATYYAMLPAAVISSWAHRTPEDFRFTLKVPRDLLDPRKTAPAELGPEFYRRASSLGPKLSAVLLQFPPWFKPPLSGAGGNWAFLESTVRAIPPAVPAAVELRDARWFQSDTHERLLALLRELDRPLAWSYLTYVDVPPDLTSDWVYLRFIGDHDTVPEERHGQIVVDRSGPLRTWADRVRRAAPQIRRALVFFNNHFAGYAPASAEEFRGMLDASAANLPESGDPG